MKQNFKILRGPSKKEQDEVFKKMTPDEMLLKAARFGSLKWVKIALKRGANIHIINDFALRHAAEGGYLEIVKLLLNRGANIHARDNLTLKWAILKNHLKTVKFLLDKGANIHTDDKILEWISENKNLKMIKLLKKYM